MSTITISAIKKEKQDKLTALMAECKLFFAFSDEQFEKGKTELLPGEKYVSVHNGGYMPDGNVGKWLEGTKGLVEWYKNQISINNLEDVEILDELINYECFYTGSIDDALDVLDYPRERVQSVYNKNKRRLAS